MPRTTVRALKAPVAALLVCRLSTLKREAAFSEKIQTTHLFFS
jgi:hypothetical protein